MDVILADNSYVKNRGGHIPASLTNAINSWLSAFASPRHVDPSCLGTKRGWARASRRNIILILLPCRDACPRRRRRIYGQFFLLIFITSTCERGGATKRAPPLSPPLSFSSSSIAFSPILISTGSEVATVVSLSMLHVGRHIFLAFP